MSLVFIRSIMCALVLMLSLASLSLADMAHADEHTLPTYSRGEVNNEVKGLFGEVSENMALALNRVFENYGSPNAFIKGEENSGALLFGLTYGAGELNLKSGQRQEIHWQGLSLGFDVGAENSQIFILIYNLSDIDNLFQRFPGLAGKAFFIGGVGVTYLQSEDTVIAVMRSGVGIRGGVNAGYLKFRREATVLPF